MVGERNHQDSVHFKSPEENLAEKAQEPVMVRVANANDVHYAIEITNEMESSAKARGTGIAKRSPEYVAKKMQEGKAIIAVTETGTWVGFCYIEAWGHEQFVANSGLIVAPPFRKSGVATQIKRRIFELSRHKYPNAKIFGLTTGLAVMKMNSELGYVPVTYSELTDDDEFWSGCKSCVNYDILTAKNRKNCLCTGMLYDPVKDTKNATNSTTNPTQTSTDKKTTERTQDSSHRPELEATRNLLSHSQLNHPLNAVQKLILSLRDRIGRLLKTPVL